MSKAKPERERCKQEVPDRWTRWPSFHRCERYAVKDGYCRQHHPDTVKAREQKSRDKWQKDWDRRRVELAGASFKKALEKIAAGDNDPRRTAQKALDDFNRE